MKRKFISIKSKNSASVYKHLRPTHFNYWFIIRLLIYPVFCPGATFIESGIGDEHESPLMLVQLHLVRDPPDSCIVDQTG